MAKMFIGIGFCAAVTGTFLAALVATANNHPQLSEPLQITLTDR